MRSDEELSDVYDTAHDRHMMIYRKSSDSDAHYVGIAAVRLAILDDLIEEAKEHGRLNPAEGYMTDPLVDECDGSYYSIGTSIAAWLVGKKENPDAPTG